MQWRKIWALFLMTCGTCAYAQGQGPTTLHVQIDGQKTIIEYRLWSGHPFVLLKDTSLLNWSPYIDLVHKLVDIAQCVRLEFNSTRVVGVWTLPNVGKRAVTIGSELPPLPVATRAVRQEMWLPLDSVAQVMGYKVSFDAKKQLLTLGSYSYADDMTIPGACQKSIRSNR